MSGVQLKYLFIVLLFSTQNLLAQPEVVINELMASNVYFKGDEFNEYDDWLEIYNPATEPIDMSGYFLTDNLNGSAKYKIPEGTVIGGGSYLLFWADGQDGQGPYHTNFQLSGKGEFVAILDRDGKTIINSLTYPKQFSDISYGRNKSSFEYFDKPTPGKENNSGFKNVTEPPVFLKKNSEIKLKHKKRKAKIRYTLDCSEPTENSQLYKTPVEIDTNTVIRAKAFIKGSIPSKTASYTHFVNTNHALPVLSVITNPENLWGSAGIYTNYNREGVKWERKAQIEYFENDSVKFSTPAGIRIQGNTSRRMPKKSFRLFFRPGFGNSRLEYNLYGDTKHMSFKNLVLRGGYDEDLSTRGGTLLRDPLTNLLWQKTGCLSSKGRFAVLYLNNKYWGIYEIRESLNDHFFSDYLKSDSITIIRYNKISRVSNHGYTLKSGSWEEWEELLDFFMNHNFTDDEAYNKAKELIDINNFTDLMILINACAYRSWFYGVFAYKEDREDTMWKWAVWDMDRAFTEYYHNEFLKYKDLRSYPHSIIINKLLQNPGYKEFFIDRSIDLLNSVFSPQNVLPLLDSLKNEIRPEVGRDVTRWSGTHTKWERNISTVEMFIKNRPDVVRRQMQEYFKLEPTVKLVIEAGNGFGKIQVNSIEITEFPWEGIFFMNRKITIKALPDPGYIFKSWGNGESHSEISIKPAAGMNISAEFIRE